MKTRIKNTKKMGNFIFKNTLFLFAMILSITANSQDMKEKGKQYDLDYFVAVENTAIEGKKNSGEYFLGLTADRKLVKDVQRVYIRIRDLKSDKTIFIKAIDKEVFNKERAVIDKSIREVSMSGNDFSINFGPFKSGEYEVYVKVEDSQDNMYFNWQNIQF